LDIGLDLDGELSQPLHGRPTGSFNANGIEITILRSLDASLTALKREFLDELQSLLGCSNFQNTVDVFICQLQNDVSEIVSSANSFPEFIYSPKAINDQFQSLYLPDRPIITPSDSVDIQPMSRTFCRTATALLQELANEKAAVNPIRDGFDECVASRMKHARCGIEALEVQQKIAKEFLDFRFQRLGAERTAFRDRQSADLGFDPPEQLSETSLVALRALVKRKQSRNVATATSALRDLAHKLFMAVQAANCGLIASAGAMTGNRDQSLSCSEIVLPQENDGLGSVQARLRTLRRQREEAERGLRELRSC
jgi:hypothetical protein